MIVPTMHLGEEANIPSLGLGTWRLQGEECARVIGRALELGYRHFDTAEMYGNEEEIGRVLARSGVPREELFLTSKVWHSHLAYDDVIAACEASLARLQTDYLDLYLIHWPNSDAPMEETFAALTELYETGRIRSVGVSNFTVAHLREALEASGIPIAVNQVEFHPLLYQKELKSFCDKHGIAVVAYSPLGHGRLLENETLARVADKHDASVPQIALAWLRRKGVVAIPKASSEEHLRDNLRSLDIVLDEDEIEAIDALDAGKRFVNPGFAEFDRATV